MDRQTNSSVQPGSHYCFSVVSRYIFVTWFSVYLLFLPVFLFVLYIGFNKWKKPQSSASGGLSHSDVFTLHTVIMEMASITASCLTLYGFFGSKSHLIMMIKIGGNATATTMTVQVLFHSLTCVERYLAVVRPVTYLRLRGEGGVTIRNISIGLVLVISVGFNLPMIMLDEPAIYGILMLVLSITQFPLVGYCSIYVLCVLIRPKPGEGGGHKKQIDQSKRTTVYTMVAILGALLLRLIVHAVCSCINILLWEKVDMCVINTASMWSSLPSSLVLPLLFLHRAGKLSKARR